MVEIVGVGTHDDQIIAGVLRIWHDQLDAVIGRRIDIDDIAVELTRDNAKKAGVGSKLTVKQQDISKFIQPEKCITFCNPPYGERLLEIRDAEELYKRLGERLQPSRERPCYIISPHEEFEKFYGKKADRKRKLYNGMLKCYLYQYFN